METQKNKSGYIWLLVVLVLVFFAYSMWKPSPNSEQAAKNLVESVQPLEEETNPSDVMVREVPTTSPSDTTMTTGKTVEVTVNGSNFAFDVKEIKVKKGDTVKLTFNNKEGFHDWVIDEFNAATKQLQAVQSETVTFVANKAGTFEYYCSVGKHREMGMVGKLIVE